MVGTPARWWLVTWQRLHPRPPTGERMESHCPCLQGAHSLAGRFSPHLGVGHREGDIALNLDD